MMTPEEIRQWLRTAMDETGMSVGDLSRRSGVNRSTIFRALSDNYEFVPSSRTLDRLAMALVDSATQKGLERHLATPDLYRDLLSIDHQTAVGYWERRDIDPPWSGGSPLLYLERVARNKQYGLQVARVEPNDFYRSGDLLHVLDADVLGVITAAVGDHVVVARNSGSDLIETTVMEITQVSPDGQAVVRAPTRERRLREMAIPLHASVELDGLKYAVTSLIVAMHRATHYMAR